MRPAKDILFDFIRSRRDLGWPISLLTIYNKYSEYHKIDNSKVIPVISELKETDIHISDDIINNELHKNKKETKENILSNIKNVLLNQNRKDVIKNRNNILDYNKQYLNILLVGKLDEAIYWLAASLPVKNLIIFLDIRDLTPSFSYITEELKKYNLPIKIIYKEDNLLDVDEYDLVIQGPSTVSIKVLADEVISL